MQSNDLFRERLVGYFDDLRRQVAAEDGAWTVKGFIDVYSQIYTISLDTKVLSKVLELLMFPVLQRFADEHDYEIRLASAQNQYPDVTFIARHDPAQCYALDIKTTFRTRPDKQGRMLVNGMTLGTFQGYFRNRAHPVSSLLAYDRYIKHYVLGVIYSRVEGVDERKIYAVKDLQDIPSVANNFEVFLHEKYRIASDQPGSGNTKNIGSSKLLERLLDGTGVFSELGIEVFDDYWMNYQTRSMASLDGREKPLYTNLITYQAYKKQTSRIVEIPEEAVETEADLFTEGDEEDPTEDVDT